MRVLSVKLHFISAFCSIWTHRTIPSVQRIKLWNACLCCMFAQFWSWNRLSQVESGWLAAKGLLVFKTLLYLLPHLVVHWIDWLERVRARVCRLATYLLKGRFSYLHTSLANVELPSIEWLLSVACRRRNVTVVVTDRLVCLQLVILKASAYYFALVLAWLKVILIHHRRSLSKHRRRFHALSLILYDFIIVTCVRLVVRALRFGVRREVLRDHVPTQA